MSKVILILIDGLRADALTPESAPAVHRIFSKGAMSLTARTVTPSITLPAHFSLFTSLSPQDHNVTTNTGTPLKSLSAAGLVETIRYNGMTTAAVYSWEYLRHLSPPGALDFSLYMNTDQTLHTDLDIMEMATGIIQRHAPDFCFIYLEGVDQAGHEKGWMSKGYMEAVARADQAVDMLAGVLKTADPASDYTLVLQSDHGGIDTHHYDPVDPVLTIPWMAAGKEIRCGYRIRREMTILDTAPAIARILGIRPHYGWKGICPEDIFLPPS